MPLTRRRRRRGLRRQWPLGRPGGRPSSLPSPAPFHSRRPTKIAAPISNGTSLWFPPCPAHSFDLFWAELRPILGFPSTSIFFPFARSALLLPLVEFLRLLLFSSSSKARLLLSLDLSLSLSLPPFPRAPSNGFLLPLSPSPTWAFGGWPSSRTAAAAAAT